SAVLRHVRKYRPHWRMDFQAEDGRHTVGRGHAESVFAFGQPYPRDAYDAEVVILLYDTWANWHDRPNTRVSSCLHERFGLPWDAECSRYQIEVTPRAREAARAILFGCRQKSVQAHNRFDHVCYVAVHYEGDSSGPRKNLTHAQA